VGTRGRPLRDLHDSPALGASQSRVLGVEEKARVDCEGVEVRVRDLRAEVRPGMTISKNVVYRHGEGIGVQNGLLATERREDCAVIATREVAMMDVYLCV
jgi:hypothetical protein